jgi:hypothetical protein
MGHVPINMPALERLDDLFLERRSNGRFITPPLGIDGGWVTEQP